MEIISQYGANYLVCAPSQYNPNPEILFFGETQIYPGIRISKIGEKKRTSFVMEDDSYLEYEGTIFFESIRYCVFSSTWEDDLSEGVIYRFAFAMTEKTQRPAFLQQFNKTGQSSHDIDCTKVSLLPINTKQLSLF